MRRVLSVAAVKAAVPARYRAAARRSFLRLSAVANAGSGVSCPCCGKEFRRFARFHGEPDQCPGCGALMRHRALVVYLRDELQIGEQGGDVLHVGPGAVGCWLRAQASVRYVSVDINPGVADVQGDITDLPFAQSAFDFTLCTHVLEHIPNDRTAIAELFRVLRPGGKAVIQVPPSELAETREDPSVTDPLERERLFGQYDHVRLCGADYGGRLEDAGFGVTSIDYVDRFDASTRQPYGLRTGEPFYLCVKPSEAE